MTAQSDFNHHEPTSKREQYSLHLGGKDGMIIKPRKADKKKGNGQSSWYYMGLVGQIGYAIALPIVGGGLLGGYIDRRLSSYPKATLLFILLGVIVSITGFIETIRELMRQK